MYIYKQFCQISFEITSPDWSQNFMDTAKLMDLTCICMQISNSEIFASKQTSKLWRRLQAKSQQWIESTLGFWSNTFFHTMYLTVSDWIHMYKFYCLLLLSFPTKTSLFIYLKCALSLKKFWFLRCNFVKVYTFYENFLCKNISKLNS